MKEAHFQTLWHKYLVDHQPESPEVYELKICKTSRFSFAAVKEHQLKGLKDAESGLFHKISDSPIFGGMKTRFTAKKPFDCLWIKATGYVCVLFYVPRKTKVVVKMSLYAFNFLQQIMLSQGKKSISLEELKNLVGITKEFIYL